MTWDVHPRSRILLHRIPDPDLQHCLPVSKPSFNSGNATELFTNEAVSVYGIGSRREMKTAD
jgi:hypothetical protein